MERGLGNLHTRNRYLRENRQARHGAAHEATAGILVRMNKTARRFRDRRATRRETAERALLTRRPL